MREAAKNIKLISDDPITRAKACSFLRIITSEDLPLINSTLEELESNLKVCAKDWCNINSYLLFTIIFRTIKEEVCRFKFEFWQKF